MYKKNIPIFGLVWVVYLVGVSVSGGDAIPSPLRIHMRTLILECII